jgi:hypothetical protein
MQLSKFDSRLLSKLAKIVSGVQPVKDTSVTWLSRHRPSAALCCCIGAGPWKFKRRRDVQQSFVDALGNRDLSERQALLKLSPKIQLDWQFTWFYRVNRNCKLNNIRFDDAFDIKQPKHILLENFKRIITPDASYPKVIGLFVRDFLFIPCFPVDRHVRAFMKEHGLPEKAIEAEALFKQLCLNPSYYSRAIFNSKAANPELKGTAIHV